MLDVIETRLFGETDAFAVRVSRGTTESSAPFALEPDVGEFALFAAGRCLTEHRHELHAAAGQGIVASLFDLFEWMCAATDDVLYALDFLPPLDGVSTGAEWCRRSIRPSADTTVEEEADWFERRRVWMRRHSLAGIDGLAAPNVAFRRVANEVEISWENVGADPLRPGIRWLEQSGAARVDIAVFAATWFDTIDHLGVEIAKARPERAADVSAWRSRLASLRERPRESRALLPSALRKLPASVDGPVLRWGPVMVAASSAGRPLSPRDVKRVREVVDAAKSARPTTLDAKPSRAPTHEPWQDGYELARDYRERMGWGADPIPDLLDHVRSLGIDVGDTAFDDEGVHGIAVWGEGYAPTIRLNSRSPRCESETARRMLLAHELCHLLHDRVGPLLAMVSRDTADWPTEARANAFAAELLMPRDALQEWFVGTGCTIDEDTVRRFLETYQVGVVAGTRHLENHGLVDDERRMSLAAALANTA